jgi:hypothetical protein
MEVTRSVDAFPNRLLGFARWLSRSYARRMSQPSTAPKKLISNPPPNRPDLKLPGIGSPGMTMCCAQHRPRQLRESARCSLTYSIRE